MFKRVSYKKRKQLFFVSCALLMWIVYQYSVRNTLELRAECMTLQLRADSSANAPERMKTVKQQLEELNRNISGLDSLSSMHELLLGEVTAYCGQNGLTLRDYSPVISYRKDDWIVETHPFTVEGKYIHILQFIHELEQQNKGKVISVDFESKKDVKTKQLSLLATIYIQNIIRIT